MKNPLLGEKCLYKSRENVTATIKNVLSNQLSDSFLNTSAEILKPSENTLFQMRAIKAQLSWLKHSHAENKVPVGNRGKTIIAFISRGARKLANDSLASEPEIWVCPS